MAVLQSNRFSYLGRFTYNFGLPCLGSSTSRHQYSSDVKFLKSIDTAHIKRGKGGRSSFSGVVCTVFGATGFVGRYVANRLGKTGTQMILPYRCDFYDARHLKLAGDLGQVLFTPFHLADDESIAKAVKYSHVVINLIGRDWNTMNFTQQQVHVEGAARLARISKEMGVNRFIHVSALNCDREHEGTTISGGSPTLAAKAEGEKAVREAFPEAIIFRPSDIYGSEDRFLRYYAKGFRSDGSFLALPKGGRNIFKQPVFVGDVAQGITNAVLKDLGQDGKTFQAVGPHRYELVELVQWFLRVMRKDPETIVGDPYHIMDLKYNPLPIIKAMINNYNLNMPINSQTLEKLERESTTDVVDKLHPTLEDLGVETTTMESRIDWELRPYRSHDYYIETVGEFKDPAPAIYTVPV